MKQELSTPFCEVRPHKPYVPGINCLSSFDPDMTFSEVWLNGVGSEKIVLDPPLSIPEAREIFLHRRAHDSQCPERLVETNNKLRPELRDPAH